MNDVPSAAGEPPYGSPRDDGWVEFSVGDALGFGWSRFWANPLPWLGLVVAFLAISIAVEFIVNGFELEIDDVTEPVGFSGAALLGSILSGIVTVLMTAVLTKAALDETYGHKATIGGALDVRNVMALLLASVIVGVLTAVGLLLFIIPGLVVMFLTYYAIAFVLDKNHDAITAIKASASLVSANVGRLLPLALAVVGINIVGALVFLVGLLITIPITTLATTHAFRTVQGERVA
ncbi:DUF2189 domain-containing protein [Solicola gregarius]|uniref:Integral membrane protein n=1 Tax=Solicola gregarius TaxID=2908642 RepID=A0AA46TJV5_9ACTN|nr:hypothetical protein [Solicola gregarius]UYM06197.1 hypothetical protein L0C25_03730 [Solicola gregarius]